jgi:hypothetical protein
LDPASENENFLKRIITGDEIWANGYDLETKMQSSQCIEKTKNARRIGSNAKVMLTAFFDIEGVVFYAFLRQGQTVNFWYYLEVLKLLRENTWRERPQLRRNNSWFLHHDNAPDHASLLIPDFSATTNTTVL